MKCIPMPKTVTKNDGVCAVADVFIGMLPDALPLFVKQAFAATFPHPTGTVPLCAECGEDEKAEGYHLTVTNGKITISADGYKGVYYALQTLLQMPENGVMPCVTVDDTPDYDYRGFYQDVSRGRIPTVETVKRLVDRLSALKMNSLQLYVEHTHRFAEYVGINEDLGFYTDEEIREIDRYCREHCVELIPSLSSFGHLYALLQSPKYHHLCELEGYVPTVHNWHERLLHHTIDPAAPESAALIQSLIAQYLPLFSSSYFNICCDETFDLCKGKNVGGDVVTQYTGFVSQLAAFLKERGKTVMMWGDIVLKHPEAFSLLPKDIVYLNWCYDMNGNGLNADVFAENGATQIICPSVHSHKRLVEKIQYNRDNIRSVLEIGREYGVRGMLNTNWGDYGHLCFDEGMLYGLAYGAAKSWNVQMDEDAFDRAVCCQVYRSSSTEVVGILRTLGECDEIWFEREGYEMALWELTVQMFDRTGGVPENYEYRLSVLRQNDLAAKRQSALSCASRLRDITEAGDLDKTIGDTLALAADGVAVLFMLLKAVCDQRPAEGMENEFTQWLCALRERWLACNKTGEWQALETFLCDLYTVAKCGE